MTGKFAYYLFVYPLSFLPLPLLYLIGSVFYGLLISVFPYRRKVIRKNLQNSFPEKSTKELRQIERKFYRHLSHLLAESVKNLSIEKIALKKRLTIQNRDLLDQMYIQGKSVIIVGAHFGNWEWMITGLNFLFAHRAIGIGMPLTNAFFDEKVNAKRARFGMTILNAKNFKEFIAKPNEPIAILMLSDQSPPNADKSYWLDFLNQKTACFFGAELVAHEQNFAVVYMHQYKVKRGYYEVNFELIANDPKDYNWGEITEKHVKCLEKDIQLTPELWMWSHKRWKRELPENLDELKQIQKRKFNEKFGR